MKWAAAIIAILVLGGLGYYKLYYVSSSEAAAFSSLKFDRFPDGDFECSVTANRIEGVLRGILFVSHGKSRIDFADTHFHGIADSGKMYIWKDGDNVGLIGSAADAFAVPNKDVISSIVACKKVFSVDQSLFNLPDNIDFKQLPADQQIQ